MDNHSVPKGVLWFWVGCYLFSLFYLLGVPPLHMEEPRRALVALEMYYDDHFWVPTILGEIFYDHPPLWNMILYGVYHIFGVGNTFGIRFFSALSLFLMGVQLYFLAKKYINKEIALFATIMFVTGGDIYFYFATTGEIDLFYSLVVFTMLNVIFHFYQKKNDAMLYFLVYSLAAIGFLTKGYVTFIFLILSLVSYIIWYHKDWKFFFSPFHFLFLIWGVLLVNLYFWKFSEHGNVVSYLKGMWQITFNKAESKNGIWGYVLHFFQFPFFLLQILLPASLLSLLFFKTPKNCLNSRNTLYRFSILVVAVNIIIYWISPGTRSRYLYMLFPYIIVVLAFLYQKRKDLTAWDTKFLSWIFTYAPFAVLLISAIWIFLPIPKSGYAIYLYVLVLAAFLMNFYILRIKLYSLPQRNELLFFTSLIFVKIIFNDVVFTERANHYDSFSNQQIRRAKTIASVCGNLPLYVYSDNEMFGNSPIGIESNIAFYTTKFLKKTIRRTSNFSSVNGVVVVEEKHRKKVPSNFKVVKTLISFFGKKHFLVKKMD